MGGDREQADLLSDGPVVDLAVIAGRTQPTYSKLFRCRWCLVVTTEPSHGRPLKPRSVGDVQPGRDRACSGLLKNAAVTVPPSLLAAYKKSLVRAEPHRACIHRRALG